LEEIGPEESVPPEQMDKYLAEMEEKMREAARKFDFKQAAAYRQGPESAAPPRDIEVAMRTLVEVIRDLKNSGRKLVFPNVQEGLWRRMGQFDVEQYGFFKFKEFLQEAERRSIVRRDKFDRLRTDRDVDRAVRKPAVRQPD